MIVQSAITRSTKYTTLLINIMVLSSAKQLELEDQRVNETPHITISLKSALTTLLLFLVVLTLGNMLVELFCPAEFAKTYGKIIVRFVSCTMVIIISLSYFKIKLSSHKPVFSSTKFRYLIIGALLGLTLFIFMLFVDFVEHLIFTHFDIDRANESWTSKPDSLRTTLHFESKLILGLVVACIVAPITEEVLFRALIFKAFKLHFKTTFSMLFSAILFVVAHTNSPFVIGTITFSIALSLLYLSSGSLWPCIFAHGSFNFSSFIYENFLEDQLSGLIKNAHSNNGIELFLILFCFSIIIASIIILIRFKNKFGARFKF